jgi:DNA modification methylase
MRLEQILVWNYNNTGQRQPLVRYTSNYQIAFYYRGPDAAEINRPGDGTHQYACQTVNAPDGRIGDRYHEWQKPMELIERLIRNSSNPGDLVFDPFAGSGTTLLAAAKLGRKAIGCDIDPEAIALCVKRGCKNEEL